MKKISLALLVMLLGAFILVGCGKEGGSDATPTPEPTTSASAEEHTVLFYDSDGVTVLKEVKVKDGETVADPGLTKDGYELAGYFATPALQIQYDFSRKIINDVSIFVSWESAVTDERPWMLAGSLAGYPANLWGKAWPQDDFLLAPMDGEKNTFYIDVNLYAGDEFKIAVISETYAWDDTATLSANNLEYQGDDAVLTGGENAFDTGANIKVKENGYYRLILKSDAENLSLCKISYQKLGEAAELTASTLTFNMQLWSSMRWNDGDDKTVDLMTRNGDDYIWYIEIYIDESAYVEGQEYAEFGIRNNDTGDWYGDYNNGGKNFTTEAGFLTIFAKFTVENNKATLVDLVIGKPNYYVVGTCGNGGWAADANESNTTYMMDEGDGEYILNVTFTDSETADWAGNKVAFKVVKGLQGYVANENWYGSDTGDNICVDPGSYTITFNPFNNTVTTVSNNW